MEKNDKKQFQCSGDCLQCLPVQRQYCSSQHAYNSLMILKSMQDMFYEMIDEFEDIKNKISSIQDNEAMLFNPNVDDDYTAQEGDGAEE